ncbi:aldo/keto reductase [Thermoplasma sp. Kam2015]|uniref:aldo/keto reductase n=1 Tax=Thermoplasma sp. Kam2015 TaxID=2094122 RepID=UPI001F48D08C|nr:aldo/keto reductase [Thermoplasma sp. Kam2015]
MAEFDGTGRNVSVIGVGTWSLEGSRSDNIRSIRYAIDHGINFIDTAEMYGTEDIVGEAIKGYDREDLFIATKVWPTHFSYHDVIRSCEESLKKLKTDYIDLYQLHWPNPSISIKETMSAMEHLVDEGMIRYIGISNFSVKETEEAMKAMAKYRIVSNQLEYNVATREIEDDGVYDLCKKNGMAIIAYSPLSHGKIFDNEVILDKLKAIGRKYNRSPAQVALNWIISKGAFPIPKASSIDHMAENVASADFTLSDEDMRSLDSIYRDHPIRSIARRYKNR